MQAVLGKEQASQADVATAVALAEPEGFITIFLEEGRPVAQILANLLRTNQLEDAPVDHARKIYSAYPEAVQTAAASSPSTTRVGDGLVEPLSKRELEILRLIGEGCTNQEIADRLVVSERTVRAHVSNILAKLHLANRTQADRTRRKLGGAIVSVDDQVGNASDPTSCSWT